jgi:hypothetical protein
VPSSAYTVQAIDATCVEYLTDETAYSAALTVTTARWGDIVAPFAVDGGATQPDFIDIAAVVDKFADGAGAPTKARAELVGDTVDPDKPVDFQDIAAVVDAFQSLAYPYAGPEACP